MTTHTGGEMDKLRELADRWRAESERLYPDRDDAMALSPDIRYETEGRCEQLDACADELEAALAAQPEVGGEWPAGLIDRIKAAEDRIHNNHAPRRIPADPNGDVDLVLAEVRYLIEGNWPPFWIKAAAPTPAAPATDVDRRGVQYTPYGLALAVKVAADPGQGAVDWYMRDLLRQCLPHIEAAAAAPTPAAVGQGEAVAVVQATAPERIWLAVSDDKLDSERPFPEYAIEEVCWSVDEPLAVCVPYVRADLAHPAAVREAGAELANRVEGVAAFLIGYGDPAELAAARLRDALRSYDTAALARDGVEGGA